MISIIDPDELEHVLRPTVYAPTLGTRTGLSGRGIPSDNTRIARTDSPQQDEPVSSSQHD
jgi:hypothetical protein